MKLPHITRGRPSIYDTYVDDLTHAAETNPPEESWLPWPNQKTLTEGTRRTYRGLVNRGEFFGDGFEARTRAGYLYVRRII